MQQSNCNRIEVGFLGVKKGSNHFLYGLTVDGEDSWKGPGHRISKGFGWNLEGFAERESDWAGGSVRQNS